MTTERSDDAPVLAVGNPVLLVDEPSETGEGPLWHEDEQALYWLDIPTGRLFRYDPASKVNELAYQHDAMIGGFTFQDDGSILLFCSEGKILSWSDGTGTTVINEIPEERNGRFNDVIADPVGRVFCGTMPTEGGLARLYLLDVDGTLTEVFDDIGLSNGMGFTADRLRMFHTDTNFRTICQLDYDDARGELTKRTPLVRTPQDAGVPDGMCVDAMDTIWSARWDGHGLFCYAVDGSLTGFVRMPVRKVSSVTFGGRDYRTAFVTTAGGHLRGDEEGELAGSLFSVDLGVEGKPAFRSRIEF